VAEPPLPAGPHVTPETVVRRERLTACRFVDDWAVVMVTRENRVYRFEGTGARIVSLAEDPVSLAGLCDAICREYDAPRERVETDVTGFVRDLLARKVLVIARPEREN